MRGLKADLATNSLRPLAALFALAITCGAYPVAAQKASVEINQAEDSASSDPHPAVYTWSGQIRRIVEPHQYYTYYYTGEVDTDASVPVGSRIQRIGIPNTEWETLRREIIGFLTAHYETAFSLDDTASRGLRTVTLDENFDFQETTPPPQQNTSGIDPVAAAEWTFYLDQFVLWQYYCKRILLNNPNATTASGDDSALQRVLDLEALEGVDENVDVDKLLEAAAKIRGEDDEDEEEVAGAQPAEDEEDTGPAIEFDPDAIYDDPGYMDKYRKEFVYLAGKNEENAMGVFTEMLGRIGKRQNEYRRYEEWIAGRQRDLIDFARAWGKVQEGNRVNFDDTFYLITKEPLEAVPENARNIVVRDVITPQDLITRDGKLKGPQYDPDAE